MLEHFKNWLVALRAFYRAILDSILLSLVKYVRGIPIRILLLSDSLTKFHSEMLSNNKDNVQNRILLPSASLKKFYSEKLSNNKENVQNNEIESPYYTFWSIFWSEFVREADASGILKLQMDILTAYIFESGPMPTPWKFLDSLLASHPKMLIGSKLSLG